MGATLTQQRRVSDEGLRVVKLCLVGKNSWCKERQELMVPLKEAPANSVPAAAVIRRVLALFGIIGRKGRVGGLVSQM
jgi:hypothetical protein